MYVCAHESLSICNDAQGYRMIINNKDNVHKFSIKVLPLMIEKFRRSIRNKHLNDFHAFFFLLSFTSMFIADYQPRRCKEKKRPICL